MDAYKAIITKRDTRAYTEQPIPDDALERIVQAGRMAGSSKNTQPTRLVVLRDPQRKKEMAACGNYAEHLPAAAVGVAICLPETGSDFDAGRSAQNMMLAAWSMGIASCPCSMHDRECATKTLGLPQGWRVCVVLALGYPDPKVSRHLGKKRVDLSELAHEERW